MTDERANDQEIELTGPDDGGWHYTPMRDWIAVCADLSPTAYRLYAILRSLVLEKRAPVRKLTLLELCQLLPGPNGKPSSLGRIRDAIRELSAIGLLTDKDGGPVTTSSSKRAAERPMLLRINDFPKKGYAGDRSVFAALDRIRGVHGSEEDLGWISNQSLEAGWKSNQVGRESNQPGRNSNHDSPLTRGNASPKEGSEGRSLRKGETPRPSFPDGGIGFLDGGTDGSGAAKTNPGVELLLAIGNEKPEFLLTGKTLRDQGLTVAGMLLEGWTPAHLWQVICGRPLPAEVKTSVGGIVAGRLRDAMSSPAPSSVPAQDRGFQRHDEATPTPASYQEKLARAAALPDAECAGDDGLCGRPVVTGTRFCRSCSDRPAHAPF